MSRWSPLKLTTYVRAYAFGERMTPERLGESGLPQS